MGARDSQHPSQPLTEEPAALPRPASVEDLFREHNQTLVRFLATRLSSRAEAKEVAQEAYVRLLQLDQPRAVGFLRAFLFKTASNIATDHLRRRRLAKAAQSEDPFNFVHELSPEEHVASGEEVDIVARCLDDLSPRCRQVVLLSRVEGKSSGEVAAELGMSTRMVRRYVMEALLLIRDRLEKARLKGVRK